MERWLPLPLDAAAHGPALDRLTGWVHLLMLVLFVGWTAFFVVLGVLCLVALMSVAIWWWVRRRSAPSRSARRPDGPPEGGSFTAEEGGTTLKELRGKWAQALARLRGSKLGRQGDDGVGALPWLVVLGER